MSNINNEVLADLGADVASGAITEKEAIEIASRPANPEPKHTPTPWHLDDGRIWANDHGSPFLVADLAPGDIGLSEADLANGPFIVKACNHYDDLLGTLKQVVAMLTQPVQFTGIRNGASCDVLRGDCAIAAKVALAAIARAETI